MHGFTKFILFLGNINNDPNVDKLCWLCENGDFKSDKCFNCTNESSRYKFFEWNKLVKVTNLMRSECDCDSNGHTLVALSTARGLSQLAEKLLIRRADPNVVNIKENKRIMYYEIDKNNYN